MTQPLSEAFDDISTSETAPDHVSGDGFPLFNRIAIDGQTSKEKVLKGLYDPAGEGPTSN